MQLMFIPALLLYAFIGFVQKKRTNKLKRAAAAA
jgi:hypothetical protein